MADGSYNVLATENGIKAYMRFDSGSGEAGSEVVSVEGTRVYVTNGAEGRIDVFSRMTGEKVSQINVAGIDGFGGLTSVAVKNGLVAVAVHRAAVDGAAQPGAIAVYDAHSLEQVAQVDVGNLPDMVRFSADGTQIYTAIEGEYSADLATQAAGGIAVIDILGDRFVGATYGFEAFDDQLDALIAAGVRTFPDRLPSEDWEPEYITIDPTTGHLLVTIQEANAVAVFDPATRSFTKILPLGTIDRSLDANALDANDDGIIDIRTFDDLVGIRMPDAIAAVEIGASTYFLTANEGDDRGDFDEGGDVARVGDILDGEVAGLSIDAAVNTAGLERLNVSIIDGDTDGDGDIDVLHAYGARGFTIFNASGEVVFESGADFERLISQYRVPNAFNNDGFPSEADTSIVDDVRSDNKGPEPEAIAVGEIGGRTFAFVGLERDGGIMVYDITDPARAEFATYIECAELGDVSPEVIQFIDARHSGTGRPMLAVCYEISGTTTLIDLGKQVNGSFARANVTGSLLDDRITTFARDNMLAGGAGDDALRANKGDDTLIGGTGDDVLFGGQGADVFVMRQGDGRDVIHGFTEADHIDLTATGLEFSDLTVTERSATRTIVQYGDDRLVITHTARTQIDAEDFLFG